MGNERDLGEGSPLPLRNGENGSCPGFAQAQPGFLLIEQAPNTSLRASANTGAAIRISLAAIRLLCTPARGLPCGRNPFFVKKLYYMVSSPSFCLMKRFVKCFL